MNKKYTVKQLRKKKDLVCEAPHREFEIGEEKFKILLYGIYNDEDKNKVICESYYACFMNGVDNNPPCYEALEECYQHAIDLFNLKNTKPQALG
jgi:hypothetical protein